MPLAGATTYVMALVVAGKPEISVIDGGSFIRPQRYYNLSGAGRQSPDSVRRRGPSRKLLLFSTHSHCRELTDRSGYLFTHARHIITFVYLNSILCSFLEYTKQTGGIII